MQAGIRQIDKIAPSAPMSFQTDSMIPIGSLQPSSNTFPAGQEGQQQQLQQQQPVTTAPSSYPGLPHAPTAQQAQELGPVTTPAQPQQLNPALLAQAPVRKDPFGATPFLPPPPGVKTSHRQGSAGRYQAPPGPDANNVGLPNVVFGNDRYAAFDSIASSAGQQQPQQQQQQAAFSNQGTADLSWIFVIATCIQTKQFFRGSI